MGDDARVKFDVRCRCHPRGQLRDHQRPANFFEQVAVLEFLGNHQQIDRFFVGRKVFDNLEYFLVFFLVKTPGIDDVGNRDVGIAFEHQRPQNGFFHFNSLWWYFSILGINLVNAHFRLLLRILSFSGHFPGIQSNQMVTFFARTIFGQGFKVKKKGDLPASFEY